MVKGIKKESKIRKEKIYALYKGDTFIDLGTKKYLADKLGVKKDFIEHMHTPSYRKRIENKNSKNAMIVITIEDDEEDK